MAKCKACSIRGCKTIVSKCGAKYNPQEPAKLEPETKKIIVSKKPVISRTNKTQSFINETEENEMEATTDEY
jgi:hypothetical protein